MRPFPGAIETLVWLRERGVRSALLTNGAAEAQRAKLERFGLPGYFDCVVIEGEFGVGKPDERVYHHALEQLRAAPDETWMVGDNLEWDVAAPQRLGLSGVWVDCFARGLPEDSPVRPNWILRRLSELRGLLAAAEAAARSQAASPDGTIAP
jgi:putative hydrolase of the HAD superfamily